VSRTVEQKGITFRIEGTARDAIRETNLGLKQAMQLVALAWQGRSVRYLSTNIYNRPIPLGKDGKRQWIRTNRLRSSVAWEADEHSATVGSNVEYAPVVHEGLNNAQQSVKAHTRTQSHVFGRKVKPFRVNVGAFTRTINRAAVPFISQPGYDLLPNIPRLIVGELNE
jgi:phage gpG-like protein